MIGIYGYPVCNHKLTERTLELVAYFLRPCYNKDNESEQRPQNFYKRKEGNAREQKEKEKTL